MKPSGRDLRLQLPASNLLRELKELCGVEEVVVSAQVGEIADSVRPGFSDGLRAAVPAACCRVLVKTNGPGPC